MKNPLAPTTVDGVMNVFTKAINQLTTVAEQNETKAEKCAEQRRNIERQERAAAAEAERARKMSDKLSKMIEE